MYWLCRLERDDGEESQQALRNLVLLMGTLTTSGYSEIKPSQACSGSLFKMPGFSVPQPVGKGIEWNRHLQVHVPHYLDCILFLSLFLVVFNHYKLLSRQFNFVFMLKCPIFSTVKWLKYSQHGIRLCNAMNPFF